MKLPGTEKLSEKSGEKNCTELFETKWGFDCTHNKGTTFGFENTKIESKGSYGVHSKPKVVPYSVHSKPKVVPC